MMDLKRENAQKLVKRIDDLIVRFTILVMLFIGAIVPLFRTDSEALYVSAACVVVLTVMAGFTLFKRRSP